MATTSLLDQRRTTPLQPESPNAEDRSPIYGCLKQASMVDFPDRSAAILFTTGCNFRCGFCHNFEQLGTRRRGYTWDKLRAIVAGYRNQWTEAVVVSGGEPTLHHDLPRLLRFLRSLGMAVKLDTNGSLPERVAEALPLVDYVAMDIKCSLSSYPAFVKFADADAIRRSIDLIKASGVDYQFRTTLLESFHDDEELAGIAHLAEGARHFVLQPFLPKPDLPDVMLRALPRTSPQAIRHAADFIRPHVRRLTVRGD